jgi:CO/xanthine dehydrogenase FAD-binding subunit
MDGDKVKNIRLVLMSVGEVPILSQKAVEMMVGEKPTAEILKAVAEAVATSEIDPATDLHATADYRRSLIRVLVTRSLAQSIARAEKGG